ncbi:ABC transporter substrate-binding protein [Paenibacillus agricola]|uniref:Peptide ABC transporter n=1 Tax=Paenibacillus agricola TaxID=2716264 RepID=A0ABX0JA87_9BACL|nr:ABC transporter substrate-binding protein [Paenibacillus agricola]NHN31089.1 peptide ABC transporter [Paenibacillus agricola]
MKRNMFWRPVFVISCLALAIAISGCSVANKKAAEESTTATESHKLVVDLGTEPSTLDPGLQYNTDSYAVYRNIFDSLLTRDPKTLEIKPGVAESWKADSPTSWTFKIRENIVFHNGEKLTAEDVVFSIERILNKDFRSPQLANFSMITSAKASGNSVVILTKEPSPTLLTQLVNLSIVPMKYVKEKGDEQFNLQPVGSGAYKFTEWTKGIRVSLTANDTYWGGKPNLAGAEFRFVPTPASRVADLQSGKADVILAVSPDDVETIKANADSQVLSTLTERVAYLGFNVLGDSPTKSSKVNQAIAYGINYDAMISSLLHGYGESVTQVLTPFSFGYDKSIKGYKYDPEKSKALLKEAGYPDGVTLVFDTSPAYDQRIVQSIQGDLEKVGIKITIASTDQATYLKKVQDPAHKWGSIRFGIWSCSCMDADGTIYPLFRTGTIWNSYSNPVFDQAVDAARATTNVDERTALYKKALEVLNEDVPGIGLYQTKAIYGASKKLQWQPDAQESFLLKDMKWIK